MKTNSLSDNFLNGLFMVLMKTTAIRRFPKWSPYGLFMVFPKTSAAEYFPFGLHMGFLRSSQRPPSRCKSAPEAGWSSRRPSVAFTKTAILLLPAVGLYKGFLGSLQRPVSSAYKDQSGGEKKSCRPAVYFDRQSSSPGNSFI